MADAANAFVQFLKRAALQLGPHLPDQHQQGLVVVGVGAVVWVAHRGVGRRIGEDDTHRRPHVPPRPEPSALATPMFAGECSVVLRTSLVL